MADALFFDPKKEAEVKRRRLLAEQLAAQGQQSGTEVVSGIVVPKSPLEGLAKALTTGVAGYQAGQADRLQTEDAAAKQKLLAEAVGQYGTDPAAAAQLLMQSPATSDVGMQMYMQDIKRKQDLELAQAGYAREDAKWEKDAALKRELKAMGSGGGAMVPEFNPETGGYDMVPSGAPRKLSATEQKEFYEAEDTVASAPNLLGALEEAKTLNKTAYSGAMADERAWLVSNVGNIFGKETPDADATVNMKNVVQSQALENLKNIFGGMPTEGERKILLEMQASTDKTPKQREEILNRAMQMAQRRIEASKQKMQGISTGSIYQGNVPQMPQAPQPPANRDNIIQQLKARGRDDAYIQQFLSKNGL